ncbi:MAG: winged helix-turn-helix transcriptional regulator [Gemmatimonadales bacterium]|nr:winged helix-turn-helix transcriptional regulator [Gemmatimonadales bacterium]
MVTQASGPVFGAIADPTRRAILDALREGPLAAGDIANLFPVSRPAVSRHLRVLRQAGLLRERRVAQSRIYALDPEPLQRVEQWLSHYRVFWAARLMDLKRHLESEHARTSERKSRR